MKISKPWIRICNIACAVLMLVLLVLQCLPFWTMPTCECTELRCELDVNTDCPACAITEKWCVVPTSCICEYICDYSTTNMDCPVCYHDIDCCFSTTPAPVSSTEENEDFLSMEELPEPELRPTGPIPEDAEPKKVSIQEFTWLSTFESCEGVFKYFDGIYSVKKTATTEKYDFMLNDIILMPVVVLFFALIGGFLCIIKSDKTWVSLFPLFFGVVAIYGYLTQPIFQAGALWQLHLGIGIAVLVVSLLPNITSVLNIINWFRPKKG